MPVKISLKSKPHAHSLPMPLLRSVPVILVAFSAYTTTHAQQSTETVKPPGQEKSLKTRALETGAKVLQSARPLQPFDVYLVGFHPMKDDPEHQMEAHHYCNQVNEEFAQCVLFDGNDDKANLTGIEYIVSERIFLELPLEERKYWHPHNGEILSGQLMAPGIPQAAEKSLMKSKMNSYGKTWHVWRTGDHDRAGDTYPIGPAMLAWSFNRDGEAKPAMVEARDSRLDTNTAETRKNRQDLIELAKPQYGVDVLKGKFDRPVKDIPGVKEADPK